MATDVLGFLWNTSGDSTFRLNDPSIGNLEFDTLDQETHEWNRDVTMNPVENGSPISDHIIRQPRKLTVAGMISNAPVTGVLTQLSNAIANGFDGEDRVNTAIKLLDSLYVSNELVTIYTKSYTYENMLIQHINLPRRVEDGDAVNFTIDAVQCDIVSTATTELPPGVGVKNLAMERLGLRRLEHPTHQTRQRLIEQLPQRITAKIPVQFSNRHPMVYLGLAESWAII